MVLSGTGGQIPLTGLREGYSTKYFGVLVFSWILSPRATFLWYTSPILSFV